MSGKGALNFMSLKHQKKVALINDFSGYGRCSITVALPIISHLKVQCCPVPTSVFSNHTGFPSFYMDDYTEKMPAYIEEWRKLGLHFECISSGFLGSARQIGIVRDFIRDFQDGHTTILVDPVMGDNGRLYSTYTAEMCCLMKQLACCADVLTPNLTEACILTDTPWHEGHWHTDELYRLGEQVLALGPSKAVISGVSMGSFIGNVVCESGNQPVIVRRKRIGQERSGTGDVFSAIITADCVNGVNFETSVRRASAFIQRCIEVTEEFQCPRTDGVCFEEVLWELKA